MFSLRIQRRVIRQFYLIQKRSFDKISVQKPKAAEGTSSEKTPLVTNEETGKSLCVFKCP